MARYALPDDFLYSTTGRVILNRLLNDRSMKILVTARSAGTGLGKTTLAIGICRWTNRMLRSLDLINQSWDAEKNAHITGFGYARRMDEIDQFIPQIADEIESQAGKLDFHSNENKKLKEVWSEYRYKNVLSIGTLPTTQLLDSDLKVLADMWIHVTDRGQALPKMWYWNDFREEHVTVPLRAADGGEEVIYFRDISGTKVFETVHQLKENKHDPEKDGEEYVPMEEHQSEIQSVEQDARKQKRDELIRRMNDSLDVTQREIAEVVDLSQTTVNQIVNNTA